MNVSRQSETMILSPLFHYRTSRIFTVACLLCFGIHSLEQHLVFHNKQTCNVMPAAESQCFAVSGALWSGLTIQM